MRFLLIENCKECKHNYTNYMPDGSQKNGKKWCSNSNKEIKNENEIADHCLLGGVAGYGGIPNTVSAHACPYRVSNECTLRTVTGCYDETCDINARNIRK